MRALPAIRSSMIDPFFQCWNLRRLMQDFNITKYMIAFGFDSGDIRHSHWKSWHLQLVVYIHELSHMYMKQA